MWGQSDDVQLNYFSLLIVSKLYFRHKEQAQLKVRLERLRLESQEKVQSRQAELQLEIKRMEIEAETAIQLRRLELESQRLA